LGLINFCRISVVLAIRNSLREKKNLKGKEGSGQDWDTGDELFCCFVADVYCTQFPLKYLYVREC